MKPSILITAYQRQGMLNKLLAQLGGYSVTVFDDASTPALMVPEGVKVIRARVNHGKQGYWRWINVLLAEARTKGGDVMVLPDDVTFIKGGLDRTVELFADIKEQCPDHGACFNPLRDNRKVNWTGFVRERFDKYLDSAGWCDGLFICNQQFLQLFRNIPPVDPIRWQIKKGKGSGAWEYVSRVAYRHKALFFQARKSLVIHGEHESVMHTEHRKQNPIKNR